MINHNARWTRLLGELERLGLPRAFVLHADVGQLAEVAGAWCNYRLWFTWQDQMGAMLFTCALDGRVPAARRTAVYELLAQVNERTWIGHFDMCSDDASINFRYGMLTRGVNAEAFEDLLDIAIAECERFYPAFQSVVWGGKTPAEALSLAMFETVGEA